MNQPICIFGGAGFVGTNLALALLEQGRPVIAFDNLSRAGVEDNLDVLGRQDNFEFFDGDVRDQDAVAHVLNRSDAAIHLAAQVAVTTSLANPVEDFEINARGTLNVLEGIRNREDGAIPLVFTSTNKVYGALDDIAVEFDGDRYAPTDENVARWGIDEARPLDFHSPYGCSKGAADQYVLDYARSFGLPATVFRMSCVYGPHQKGNEDQGWVAHFLLQSLRGEPITLFGDGHQVRDVLWVGDLVRAFEVALHIPQQTAARAWNLGGGPRNAVSLLEVVDAIERHIGARPSVEFGDWRVGDQKFYVSDTRRFESAFGWRAQTSATEGLALLFDWMSQNASVEHGAEALAA